MATHTSNHRASRQNKFKNTKYWVPVLVMTGLTIFAAAVTIYTFLKEGPIPLRKFVDIALRMGGFISFLTFYIAFGVYTYVVFITLRSNKMSWQEKTTYWVFLLKRVWIFLPVFLFGNYVMLYHFIPGATPNIQQWLFTVLVELPVFTLFIVGSIIIIKAVFWREDKGNRSQCL